MHRRKTRSARRETPIKSAYRKLSYVFVERASKEVGDAEYQDFVRSVLINPGALPPLRCICSCTQATLCSRSQPT